MHRRYACASFAALATLLILTWTSVAVAAPQYRALLIANGAYTRLPPARAAAADMDAAAAALGALGYEVAAHVNLDERSMWRVLRSFFQSIGAEDTAVLYFAGRVVKLGDAPYLAPVGLDPSATFASRALLAREAFLGLERSKAKHGLFVLNASGVDAGKMLAAVRGKRGKTALFVASPDTTEATGAGNSSTFGAAFADALAILAPTVGAVARRIEGGLDKAGASKAIFLTPEDFRFVPIGLTSGRRLNMGGNATGQPGLLGKASGGLKPETAIVPRQPKAQPAPASRSPAWANRATQKRARPRAQLRPAAPPSAQSTRPPAALPVFPWPPPKPSAFSVIPRRLATGGGKNLRFGDVARRIEAALFQANYAERSYLAAPGGFALVTRLERILADGRPDMERRWFGAKQVSDFSLRRFIKELFLSDPGRYRLIVFVATDREFAATGAAIDATAAEELLQSGLLTLPRQLAALPFTANHEVTALVYEFERPEGGQARQIQPSPIDGIVHLRGAQLLQALEGR